MPGALVVFLHVAPLSRWLAWASSLHGDLMVFGQSESQRQPRFKSRGNRYHRLMGEATKNLWPALICQKDGDLENVSTGFHPPWVEIPFRVFKYLVTSCT